MNMTSPDITIFVHDNNIFLFKTGSCKDNFFRFKNGTETGKDAYR